MKKEFSTIDITRLTSKEKIFELVGDGARPSDMCETLPGFIHESEFENISGKLGVSIEELKKNFLREISAYNKKLHKPKHEAIEKRLGFKPTSTFHELPYGKCVFLNRDKPNKHECMLGDAMPMHCKIASESNHSEKLHAWYLLNHAVDADDPNSLREWAIYLKTHATIPGGELHELVPDSSKLKSILQNDVDEN